MNTGNASTEESGRRPIRVLLVDDNMQFLLAVEQLLTADPWLQVLGRATSGHEALELVAALQPDLVLMDWMMPGMNGLDATRHIKVRPGAPVVLVVSLHDTDEAEELALAAGADGFVSKNNMQDLRSLVRRLYAAASGGQRLPERED